MGDPNPHVLPAGYRSDHRFTILKLLLDAGIDPNATGRFGLTVLHFVAARDGAHRGPSMPTEDRCRFASLLLDAGADPMRRDELLCSTALGWACRYGRVELAELLLKDGAPVHEPDTPAWAQPLAWAEKNGRADIRSLLKQTESSRREAPPETG
ncbi:MAG: ankyrin repeat domain-containing protein [Planctomycetota bacterium]